MMRKEFRSYLASGCLVLFSIKLVNTDEIILQFQRNLLPTNGKDMLIISVILMVIFKNYISVAMYNSLVTNKTLTVIHQPISRFMTHWVNAQWSLTTLLFLDGC